MVTLDGRDDGNGAGAEGGRRSGETGGPEVAGEGPVLGQPGGAASRLAARPGQCRRRRQRGFPGNGSLHAHKAVLPQAIAGALWLHLVSAEERQRGGGGSEGGMHEDS